MALHSTSWTSAGRPSAALEVHLLGLVDFDSALFLQERLVYEISGRDDRRGGLLVCEHPPLVTIGREGSRAHLRADPEDLTARQLPIRWINRGGGCLVHAPGQLAVYPVVPLRRLGLGLADYRRRLEASLVDVCGELRIPAWRRDDQPGVWTRGGPTAHVGVAVKSWVAWQGLFVNVCPDLDLQRLATPCPADGRVTSLAVQRQSVTSMHAVREGLVRRLAHRLGYENYHVHTGHPLLRRTTQKVRVEA